MKSKKDNFLQAKELQKFFNKITRLMLVKKNTKFAFLPDMPALIIAMKEYDFAYANHYNIRKTLTDLLDDKYPLLNIDINKQTLKADYSIQDEMTGMSFFLKTGDATHTLMNFLHNTDCKEPIPIILLTHLENDAIVLNKKIADSVLLILDGYFLW